MADPTTIATVYSKPFARAKTDFMLGGIAFFHDLFEVPQDLEIGLETWGSVHRLPQSGTTQPKMISQTFGVFPKPITWEARFLGKDAEDKARRLGALHQAQTVVPLVVGTRSWDVVIWEFTETIRSRFDIGLKIMVKPLAERSGRTPGSQSPVDASTNLKSQFVTMQGLQTDPSSLDARMASVNTAVQNALSAIAGVQPEALSSTVSLLAVYNTIQTTIATISSVQTAFFGSNVSSDWTKYLWLAALLSSMKSYNQTLATFTGQDNFVQVQMRTGDNLFTVAAAQFGDWTRAFDIMQSNGLTDVFASAPQTVSLPRN